MKILRTEEIDIDEHALLEELNKIYKREVGAKLEEYSAVLNGTTLRATIALLEHFVREKDSTAKAECKTEANGNIITIEIDNTISNPHREFRERLEAVNAYAYERLSNKVLSSELHKRGIYLAKEYKTESKEFRDLAIALLKENDNLYKPEFDTSSLYSTSTMSDLLAELQRRDLPTDTKVGENSRKGVLVNRLVRQDNELIEKFKNVYHIYLPRENDTSLITISERVGAKVNKNNPIYKTGSTVWRKYIIYSILMKERQYLLDFEMDLKKL